MLAFSPGLLCLLPGPLLHGHATRRASSGPRALGSLHWEHGFGEPVPHGPVPAPRLYRAPEGGLAPGCAASVGAVAAHQVNDP